MQEVVQVQPKSAAPSSFAPARSSLLQRKCACGGSPSASDECEECSKQKLSLQRSICDSSSGARDSHAVPPIVHEVLRSPDQPLDTETRAFMEPRFGHDFSRVRVHTDAKSVEATKSVGARAFTVGENIYFGRGMYSPESPRGRELMAHELTHVTQNYRAETGSLTALRMSHPTDALEQEADKIARRVVTEPALTSSVPIDVSSVAVGVAQSGLLLRDETDQAENAETPEEPQPLAEESPCTRALTNDRELRCPGSNDRSTWLILDAPCKWTMFKNTGTCVIGVAQMTAAGEFPEVKLLKPGEMLDLIPIKGVCDQIVVSCTPNCSGRGHVKWGPPCIA